MSLDGDTYDCKKCKRSGCLLKSKYIKFTNVPTKSILHNRLCYVSQSNVWLYYDLINSDLPVLSKVRTLLGICPMSVVNKDTFEIIKRYNYCKNNPYIPAFPGSYDEQPPEWLWMVSIIEDELRKVNE